MIKAKDSRGVSVIIPTFKDTDNLIKCLQALYSQSYLQDRIEIIVVNNDPKENISYLQNQFNKLIILSEDKVGSYAARNRGVQCSTREILAFTDSDCIPNTQWLKKGVDYLKSHRTCMILGGEIKKVFLNQKSPTSIELYDHFSFHQQEKYASKYHFAVTANLFVKREVFNRIGSFNEKMKSGGDSEFGNRAWNAGFDICYDSDAVVTHQAIHDIKQLLGKIRRVTGGKFQRNKMASEPFTNIFLNLVTIYFSSIIKVFGIRQKVSVLIFFELFILEIVVQTVVLVEYLKLKFGGLPLRSY